MQRVMIVTNSLTGGGAERSMNLVSNELTDRGWKVALVPINSGLNDLVLPKCEVFPLHRSWRAGLMSTTFSQLRFNFLVYRWKPDCLILNCDLPELFGAFTLKPVKIVVVEHSSLAWVQRKKIGAVVREILKRRKSTWVAVSSHLKIWPSGETPYRIMPNPLMPTTLNKEQLKSSENITGLVYIGRLSNEKRPSIALEVARITGLPLRVVGDGELMQSLQEQAKQVPSSVTFEGYVSDPWQSFKPGEVLLAPSASEGDGLVVIEAISRGIPFLASDIADFRRFELPEVNYCTNADDFAKRILQFKDKASDLQLPTKIQTAILKTRSLKYVGDAWEDLLKSIG